MKIRLLGAELLHADEQTDITKLIVALRKFAKAPKTVVEAALNCHYLFCRP